MWFNVRRQSQMNVLISAALGGSRVITYRPSLVRGDRLSGPGMRLEEAVSPIKQHIFCDLSLLHVPRGAIFKS